MLSKHTAKSSVRLLAGIAACVLAIPAAAETDAKWRPNAQNDPKTCAPLWRAIGLPSYAKSVKRDATLVCHERFMLSHNNAARSPDWVIERLEKAKLTNAFDRPDKSFVQETRVPPRGRAQDEDYQNTKAHFARGHMAPSEDFNNSEEDMKASFVLSNAVPQVGAKFNSSIWGRLEDEVRKAAIHRGEIYVITGPIQRYGTSRTRTIAKARSCASELVLTGPVDARICAARNKNPKIACKTGVAVPIALYKIVYDPQQDTAHAFVMPNRDHDAQSGPAALDYLDGFRVKVAAVERVTGVRFLRGLPAASRKKTTQQCASESFWAPAH